MAAICRNGTSDQRYIFRDTGTSGLTTGEYSVTWQQLILADRAASFQTYYSIGPTSFSGTNYDVCFDGDGGTSNNMAAGAEGGDTYSSTLPVVGVWKQMGFRRVDLGGGNWDHIFYYDLAAGTGNKVTRNATPTPARAWDATTRLIFSNDAWAPNSEGGNMMIRSAKLWERLLTEADLQSESASSSIVTSSTNLWGQWPLATDLNDISGNARHLSAQGSITFGEIVVVGVGAQAATSTTNASVVCAYPAGYTAFTDDIGIVWVTGKPTDAVLVTAAASWTENVDARVLREVGTNDLRGQAFWRDLTAGNTAPTFVCPTSWGGTGGGMAVQMAVFRNVDPTSPFDATTVTSNSTAAATFVPTGITTVSSMAQAISFAITSDDNALNNSTGSQGFEQFMGGTAYDTTIGGDHAVGMASRSIATASAVTMPTWVQATNGNDLWAAITMALKPVAQSTAAAAAQVPYQPWQARGPVLAQ